MSGTPDSEDELQAEWRYRYYERIGMLCGSSEPTTAEKAIARNEANAAVKQLRETEAWPPQLFPSDKAQPEKPA